MAIQKVKDSMRTTTALDATKLSGNIDATQLTGNVPTGSITAASVTQHSPPVDLSSVENDIALLALHQAMNENKSAYNLANTWVDQFENATYITNLVQCARNEEKMSSVYTTSGKHVADANTVLLVDFETDPITDSSTTPHTLTANGGAARVSNASKFGSYSGRTGSGYWLIPSSTDFAFPASTDFTIEFWVNIVSWAVNADKQFFSGPGAGAGINIGAASASSYQPYYHTPSPGVNHGTWSGLSHTGNGAAGGWFHYALSRSGGTIWSHSNGVRTGTATYNASHIAELKYIGKYGGGQQWDFYMDELRVTKGLARYGSGNFTPQADIPVDNATGSFTSTTVIPQDTTNKSKVGLVVLYKEATGSNHTLNTSGTGNLVAKVRANTSDTNYNEVVLVNKGTFSSGVKIAIAPALTVTAGQALGYKIEFAGQSNASLTTQVLGVAMTY
jgi:hypothetical protein